MSPEVRPAGAADTDDLDALRRAARLAIADQRGGRAWLDDHVPAPWDAPHQTVLVGTLDGVVLGYAVVAVGERVARLTEIFVDPEARQLGCGEALLDAALESARHAGCRRFDGIALPGDRATKNLFERAGIVARAIVVSTEL